MPNRTDGKIFFSFVAEYRDFPSSDFRQIVRIYYLMQPLKTFLCFKDSIMKLCDLCYKHISPISLFL